jgi:hypothetical protein
MGPPGTRAGAARTGDSRSNFGSPTKRSIDIASLRSAASRDPASAAAMARAGVASKDYPNYQKTIEFLSKETFESQVAKGGAWIGTPGEIRKSIAAYDRAVDGFESASLQVNFGMIGQTDAEQSMALFAREVMPHFKN